MFVTSKIILVLLAIIAIMSAAGYYGYSYLEGKIDREQAKNIQLTIANESKEKQITQMKEDAEKLTAIREKVDADFAKARNEVQKMRNKFEGKTSSGVDKNIGKAAIEQTQIIEKAVNQGTVAQTRCFEILSGAPLTEGELNGTIKNNICPEYFPTTK